MTTNREIPLPEDLGMAERPITRARALKLAGAALAGSAFSLFWATDEADARRRRRRRKKKKKKRRPRRRRKARANTPQPINLAPGNNTISITNPDPNRSLTIRGVQVIGDGGSVISTRPLVGGPVTIGRGKTLPITVALDATDLVNADGLRLLDGAGRRITVVNGDAVGDIDVL